MMVLYVSAALLRHVKARLLVHRFENHVCRAVDTIIL
jgi:hypothetical protein